MAASALAERAACAALYWAKPERRDPDAILGAVAGLSEADRADVVGLLRGKEIPALSDDELLGRMLELSVKARSPERKIMDGTEVKSVATIAAVPVTGSGTFSGYLAAYGRDHGGDTIQPGAMDASAAALNSGQIQWHLTDAHSEKASDVVATVTSAAVDRYGLRIEGQWAPTQAAQALRQMVKNGHRLGLSIDYFPDAARPDGKGGRYLDRITIVGGAVTPKPMNPGAVITEGKSGPWAQVVTVRQSIAEGAARRDPARERLRRMADVVSAAGWPPPELAAAIGTEAAYGLIMDAAAAKAARVPAFDDGGQAQRARYEQANAYSTALHQWMAEHRQPGRR